jgi:hypothetical protein
MDKTTQEYRRTWEIELKPVLYGDIDWVHMAPDRVQWRALVNTPLTHRVPWEVLEELNDRQAVCRSAPQEPLCSMELAETVFALMCGIRLFPLQSVE